MADWSQVAIEAAQLLDDLEAEFGDSVSVGTVAIVVEVSDDDFTGIHYRCSDERRWAQAGLFEAAQRAVYASSEPRDDG